MALAIGKRICQRAFSTSPYTSPYFPKSFPQDDFSRVREGNLLRFCELCLTKAGARTEHARAVARVLVEADMRAVYSHGINRLKMYVDECKTGTVDVSAEPLVEKESGPTAVVNGNNVLGAVCGEFSMKLAIDKAKEHGIGWVVANNSNHYGIAGHYAMMALEEGYIGMSLTNTSPIVVPTRGKNAALGTNPIAVAAPSTDPAEPFVLDMASSAVALGQVEVVNRKGEKLPLGWSMDREGRPTDDATSAVQSSTTGEGGLTPLGGMEVTSGYKGYGLGMMVEVLCGVLSGANFGRKIRTWQSPLLSREGEGEDDGEGANLGQCFVAIDPSAFAPGFPERVTDLVKQMRDLPSGAGQPRVMVPGEPELNARREQDAKGIRLHESLIRNLDQLSEELSVPRIEIEIEVEDY